MVIFLRHGETQYNREHKFQGVSDSPLTDAGIAQAKAMGKFLIAYHPVRYILSPLPRVSETFKYIRAVADAPAEINPLLSEISYGAWEGLTKEAASRHERWEGRESDRFTFIHPGSHKGKHGESYKQLHDRLISFFSGLFGRENSGTIVVIAHQGVLVAAKTYYGNLSPQEAARVRIPNDTAVCVQRHGDSYEVTDIVI